MTPDLPEDFIDFVRCLREEECDFVIVGAHAIAAHGAPRATGDLDVLVRFDPENAPRVFRALVRPPELSRYTVDDPTDLWAGENVVALDTGCGNGGFLTSVEFPACVVYESRTR